MIFRVTEGPYGSELARESGVTFNIIVDWHIAFASKLAPTGFAVSDQPSGLRINTANGGRFNSSDND